MEDQQVHPPVGHIDDLVVRKLAKAADDYNSGEHEEDDYNKVPVIGEVAEQIPQKEHVGRAEEQENGDDQFGLRTFGVQQDGFREGEAPDNDNNLDHDHIAVVLLFFEDTIIQVLED
jgi:hypothetical protein